ncbi:unnamed protein product [Rotaria sp. Silwood1]|nr:unnamed protein product [Rotaria sp. Silwood1]CAF3693392.1 unnamed protein product [Rotaria sp. Silwood1]CAF4924413.1 unnamed protein product [Rotaria sp. Silwood1]
MSSTTPDNIILSSEPSFDIIEQFSKLSITLPIHQQKIQLKLDPHCNEDADIIQNCLALHIGLSLVEYILQESPQCVFWLKDHFLPSNHIVFTKEVQLSENQIHEILNIVRESSKWPQIIFKDNKQIRSMLHIRESLTNTVYGLYIVGEDEDNHIYMNSQLIREAMKAPTHLQASYSIMIGIKYLHEFAHFVYAKYGRLHLRNSFGIPFEASTRTPIGILRGESGNRFEEQMLGFVLSHAGHSNIPMDIKMCLAHSNIDDHLRIISNDFIDKLLQKETYNVSLEKHNFLHYDYMAFSALQRYYFDKAADIHVFHDHDDFLQALPIKELSFSDDEMHVQNKNKDNDDEYIQPFHLISDKIIL